MKYIKKFETGEWSTDVDWEYVKENPDDDSEEAGMILYLQEKLEDIIELLDDTNIFEILDIRGFDLYTGAYAVVKIFNMKFKIWSVDYSLLFIEDFPINNSDPENKKGFVGDYCDIADLLNDINKAGSIETYMISKKYNL
jgi:hypothetical protein